MGIDSLIESRFFHPYYLIHVMLIGSYFPMRLLFDMSKLQATDTLSFGLTREQQIFACSGIFFFLKFSHLTTWDAIFNRTFNSFKFCALVVSLTVNAWMFAIYLTAIILISLFISQPEFEGGDDASVILFSNTQEFYNTVECAPKEEKWLVFFYARWASDCVSFSPLFYQLSSQYRGGNIKFGKLDVSVCPGYAKKYNVSIKPSTKQLPTLILFENGNEISRIPEFIDKEKTKVKKIPLKYNAIVDYFRLNDRIFNKNSNDENSNENSNEKNSKKTKQKSKSKSKKSKKA